MAQHDALGPAAGARGVDEAGEIVGRAGRGMVDRRRVAGRGASASAQVSVGTGELARCVGRVHEEDEAHAGRLRHGRQQPLGQRRAGADHRRDLGVPQQIGEIVGGAGGVGRDGDAAGQSGSARSAMHHSGPVLGHDQHPVARRDARAGARQRARSCASSRRAPPAPRPIGAVASWPTGTGRSPPCAAERSNMATRLAPRSGIVIVRCGSPMLAQARAARSGRGAAGRRPRDAGSQTAAAHI